MRLSQNFGFGKAPQFAVSQGGKPEKPQAASVLSVFPVVIRKAGLIPQGKLRLPCLPRLKCRNAYNDLVLNQRTRLRGGGYKNFLSNEPPIKLSSAKDTAGLAPQRLILMCLSYF
jgi:hypothetical protein